MIFAAPYAGSKKNVDLPGQKCYAVLLEQTNRKRRNQLMIRAFIPKDLTPIMDIWLDANIQAHDFISADYWKNHFEQVKECLPAAELYVYEDMFSSPCGFMGMSGDYIAGIFVRTDVRSKGIGKQLLDHVKSLRDPLSLHVYQKNEAAVRFYLREDFVIQSQASDTDTGETEYLMTWRKHSEKSMPGPGRETDKDG